MSKFLCGIVIEILILLVLLVNSDTFRKFKTSAIRELLIPSLFPNVPPYIKFPADNESARLVPDEIREHLIWKQPKSYLIAEIVSKAGFKLRRNAGDVMGGWHYPNLKPNQTFPIKKFQKFRHFPEGEELFTKSDLAKLMSRAGNKFGAKEFNFIPRSFVLPDERHEFRNAWTETEDKLWIEKVPATSRGRGIRIIKHPDEVATNKLRVVQKYITETFTLEGNKSHLIMYAVVTSTQPLRLFLRDDLALTVALSKYTHDVDTLKNKCIHIPNYATFVKINCSRNYTMPSRSDTEREKLHEEFYVMLAKNKITKQEFMDKVEDAIIKSFLVSKYFSRYSKERPTYHSSKYNAFHYMSIDFAIDSKGTPYLLEVNHSPNLRTTFDGRRDEGLYRRKSKALSAALTLAGYHLPASLPPKAQRLIAKAINQSDMDVLFNHKLYEIQLTQAEQRKHNKFEAMVNLRQKYLRSILKNLTPDDVRHLILAEDELNRNRFYRRIYPSKGKYKYLRFIRHPYYDMLQDAYEEVYADDRDAGRKMLAVFTSRGYHLED